MDGHWTGCSLVWAVGRLPADDTISFYVLAPWGLQRAGRRLRTKEHVHNCSEATAPSQAREARACGSSKLFFARSLGVSTSYVKSVGARPVGSSPSASRPQSRAPRRPQSRAAAGALAARAHVCMIIHHADTAWLTHSTVYTLSEVTAAVPAGHVSPLHWLGGLS